MYHVPVLLHPSVDGLNIHPEGTYIDLTFGGGGHSKVILEQLNEQGKLLAFDQDPEAAQNAQAITHPGFTLVQANFRHLRRYLKLHGVTQADGIMADLGISSHQIDSAHRGFSTRLEGDLDMRMGPQTHLTAQKVVNEYSEEKLHKIMGMYGEVTNARTLAAALVKARFPDGIHTISQLKTVLSRFAPRGKENKYYAQVFQALRIEVNDELGALQEMLEQSAAVLKPDGRLVVLSYHSLEDRLVKNYINHGKFSGEAEKDLYGNVSVPFRAVIRKPIEADAEELARNSRSRSAKLRIAEKL